MSSVSSFSSANIDHNVAAIAAFASAQGSTAGPPTAVTSSTPLYTENLALTSIFTPPATCFTASAWLDQVALWAGGTTIYAEPKITASPQCYPSGMDKDDGDNSVWYSPGVCPESWNYLATMTRVTGGSTVTSAYCCPAGILSGNLGDASATDYTCAFNTNDGSTVFFGHPLSVAWAESDLDFFTPKSAPIKALERQGVTFTASSSSTTSQTRQVSPGSRASASAKSTSDTNSNQGLSTGAAAGIGVGATIGGLAILGLLIWWLRKHFQISKRNRDLPTYTEAEKRASAGQYQGLPQELHGQQRAAELEGMHQRSELDAGYHGVEAPKDPRSPV